MLFAVLAGKCFLEFWCEYAFFGSWRENAFFFVLVEKCSKNWFSRKMCFYENVCFMFFFCGKVHLAVLTGKCVF